MITASLDKKLAEQRLQSTIELIDSLFSVDWPYNDAREALTLLHKSLLDVKSDLDHLDEDAGDDVVLQHCLTARNKIAEYSGYIGFIVRSSDVRNSFEIYAPIKELGMTLIDANVHVILGSEWNYSPYIFPIPTSVLESFILVGLPASEAQNALLVPVAGHELGHAMWRRTPLRNTANALIQSTTIDTFSRDWSKYKELFDPGLRHEDLATDLMARSIWTTAYSYAARQSEEVFCDFVGLYIFGRSFLHSFRYLLSPETGIRQSPYYPAHRTRAEYLSLAAKKFGVEVPDGFIHSFKEPEKIQDLHLIAADIVTKSMVDKIAEIVSQYCGEKGLLPASSVSISSVSKHLRDLSPASGNSTLSDILNAAWEIRLDIENWSVPGVASNQKFRILNDLVLKSFEVMEWQRRQNGTV